MFCLLGLYALILGCGWLFTSDVASLAIFGFEPFLPGLSGICELPHGLHTRVLHVRVVPVVFE